MSDENVLPPVPCEVCGGVWQHKDGCRLGGGPLRRFVPGDVVQYADFQPLVVVEVHSAHGLYYDVAWQHAPAVRVGFFEHQDLTLLEVPRVELSAPPVDYHELWLAERTRRRDLREQILRACGPLQYATDGTDASAMHQVRTVVEKWLDEEAKVQAIAARLAEEDAIQHMPMNILADISQILVQGAPSRPPKPRRVGAPRGVHPSRDL